MDLKEIKNKLEKLTSEITKENLTSYYDKFATEVLNYRTFGGLGKPLYNILLDISKACEDDIYKDEILVDIMNRMTGYASPHLRILFPDLEK